jgi:hypothetical protein
MSEQPKPNGKPKEPEEIAKFRRDYADAMTHAQISAEHTATEGWMNLYGSHQESVGKARKDLSDRLNKILEPLRLRHLTEDEEKELAEIKKEAVSLREDDEAFQRQTVSPVIAPMLECNAVIESARSAARAAEREFGLGNKGLSEAMETVIETMPRVRFLTSSGRLMVGE